MNKIKLFILATFDSKHGEFSKEEAMYKLQADDRSKIPVHGYFFFLV